MMKLSPNVFQVRIASSKTSEALFFKAHGIAVHVIFAEFQKAMEEIAHHMHSALQYAANNNQKQMVESYVESFKTGSIEAHRDSQKHWIRDIGPVGTFYLTSVECNIGFIETYRDPAGIRAEWEGFVAIVNKEMTKKFEALVNGAPDFIPLLPWGLAFEKDVFNKPDFTSLEVLSFGTSGGPPAGINIPNYDDIRQDIGFKNVSLGNIVSSKAAGEKMTFLTEQDVPLFEKLRTVAFEVQVGLHELLGHGSGKLLTEEPAGQFNFDNKNPPISPITNKPVTSWYKPGETWGSVFKSAAASYEECRAEAVALYLGVNSVILNIFGFKKSQEMEDVIYIMYLSMARAGLLALEMYDPKSKKWGQAHMQARYALLRVLMQSGIVTIDHLNEDLVIHMDRSQIKTKGVEAVGVFLRDLSVYKSTADPQGLNFYRNITSVPDEWLAYRDIVLSKKQPRKVIIQGNTVFRNGKIELDEYPLTVEGVISSYVERGVLIEFED